MTTVARFGAVWQLGVVYDILYFMPYKINTCSTLSDRHTNRHTRFTYKIDRHTKIQRTDIQNLVNIYIFQQARNEPIQIL